MQFRLRGPTELRYWNAALQDWIVDASTFDVWVGGDSTAQLSTNVRGQEGVAETESAIAVGELAGWLVPPPCRVGSQCRRSLQPVRQR